MSPPRRPSSPRIPRGVIVLGLVSLCMDLSSEFVHALLETRDDPAWLMRTHARFGSAAFSHIAHHSAEAHRNLA